MHILKYLLIYVVCLFPLSTQAQFSSKFEYGVRGGLNYSTIGSRIEKYTGSGHYSLGIFFSYAPKKHLYFAAEPVFTRSGFKERQTDSRYTYSHFDLNMNLYYSPWKNDNDVTFILGLRPSNLLNFNAETLNNGTYVKTTNPANKNQNNQLDFGLNFGVNVKLSAVASFELGYHWSLTNQTDNSQLNGRNSLIESTLKINAVDVKKLLDANQTTAKAQIQNYQQGVLLVMLQSLSEKELAKFNNADREYAINELRLRNLKVMSDFKKHYTFTPVYFFIDSNANRVMLGDFTNLFLNDKLIPDTTLKLSSNKPYFVAGFSQDLYAYNDRICYGLFIYDNQLNQLGKPFTVPSQMFSLYADGDPVNYFRVKRINFTNMPFDRMIKKFNSRMIRYAEF